MLFLGILTLLNAALNNDTIVNEYRFTLGGLPISIFDVLLVLGFLLALIYPRISARFVRTQRIHPIIFWSLTLFGAGIIGGLIPATYNGASPRDVMTDLRNYLAAPGMLYAAYFLTGTFKSSRQYLYWLLIGGLIASVMIMIYFTGHAESRQIGQDVTSIRAVAFVSAYAGLAACMMFYALARKLKLMPTVLAVGALGICLVGQCGTLSRSDWLAVAAGIAATLVLLPKETRMTNVVRIAIAVPVILASLSIGLYAASRVTGKDMFTKMQTRVMSIFPGYNPGETNKAWRSRLPGTIRELEKFSTTPIFGGGFGIDDTPEMGPKFTAGLRHNTWTFTLAETGLTGFAAFAVMVFGMGIAGWRMVRDQLDKTTVLVGALGFITCMYYFIWGNATQTFNQVRWGIPLFVMAGVVLRTRAMQLEYKRQLAEEQEYIQVYGHPPMAQDAAAAEAYAGQEQPFFADWYEPTR